MEKNTPSTPHSHPRSDGALPGGVIVRAIDPQRLARVREADADEFGNPLTARAAQGWEPDFAASPSMLNPFLGDGSRAYGHIRFVAPEEDHTAALCEVLDDPAVDHLHVRSSVAGCFTFAVDREEARQRADHR